MMPTTLAYGIYLVVVITSRIMLLALMLVVLLGFGLGAEGGCRQEVAVYEICPCKRLPCVAHVSWCLHALSGEQNLVALDDSRGRAEEPIVVSDLEGARSPSVGGGEPMSVTEAYHECVALASHLIDQRSR